MGKPKKKLSAYNQYMSKALKGKMTGKTKAQRKAIFKAAAKGWKKGKSTPRSSKPKSRASPSRANPTGGKGRMGNSFNMNKIYGAIRKLAIFIPAVDIAMRSEWSNETKITNGLLWYFGWDRTTSSFKWSSLWKGWGPAIGAQIVTRVIPAINRFIRGFF